MFNVKRVLYSLFAVIILAQIISPPVEAQSDPTRDARGAFALDRLVASLEEALFFGTPPKVEPSDLETMTPALKEYLKKLKERLGRDPTYKDIIDDLDKNKDGRISEEEWKKIWTDAGDSWFLDRKGRKTNEAFCAFVPESDKADCLKKGFPTDKAEQVLKDFITFLDELIAATPDGPLKKALEALRDMLKELLKKPAETPVGSIQYHDGGISSF